MTPFSFHTVEAPVKGMYKEKGSKFLSFVFPVTTEAEISGYLKKLRKEYFDARHHCYAYRLGPDSQKFRAVDDGEPNHSAGDPIMGQIRSKNLTNVLVVVVRYFGGVKLGVGGLISAYKTAATDALNKASIIEKEVVRGFEVIYDFVSTPEVMKLVKKLDLLILKQDFQSNCKLELAVKLRQQEQFIEKIKLLNALGVKVLLTEL